MKRHLLPFAAILALSAAATANKTEDASKEAPPLNASAIIEEYTIESIAALESYLAKNPNAPDKIKALDYLIDATKRIENHEKRLKHLQSRYDLLPKGADAEPGEFFTVFQELIATHTALEDKEGGRAALEAAREDLADHPEILKFGQFIEQIAGALKQPSIGDSMDIKFTSVQGDEIDVSAMKGKVVLVDFWATWCRPCIAELPNVKATYDTYHEKGFEIVGISLDKEKTRKRLDGYISDEEAPWPHAYDGKGWQSELATRFGITSIPATFLLGKDGKVVATNLRGVELTKAVREQLNKDYSLPEPSEGEPAPSEAEPTTTGAPAPAEDPAP